MTIALSIIIGVLIISIIRMAVINGRLKTKNEALDSEMNDITLVNRSLKVDYNSVSRSLSSTDRELTRAKLQLKREKQITEKLSKENANLKVLIDPSNGHDESNSSPSGRKVTDKPMKRNPTEKPSKKKTDNSFDIDDILSEINKVGIEKVSMAKLEFLKNHSKD